MIEDQLAPLYERLAAEAVDVIPTEWASINLLGEVEEEKASISTAIYYEDAISGEMISSTEIPERFSLPAEDYERLVFRTWATLEEIYDLFVASNLEAWRQLSLHLSRNGDFEIDFRYGSDLNPEADPIVREVVWAYSSFGYRPPEGSYTRTVLDEYLESAAASENAPAEGEG